MGIGYLLGGLFGLIYMVGVGYFGGIKKAPILLKLTKMKLGKNMSDEKAAKLCLVFGILLGVIGAFLLVYGATR